MKKTIGSLLVHLGLNTRDVDNGIKKFHKDLEATGKRMEKLGKQMMLVYNTAFALGMRQAIKAFDEEVQASRRLQVALKGTSVELQNQAAAIQRVTTFADDQVITAQAWAAALGHTEGEVKKMTTAAVHLAAGLSIDLQEAMAMLHKTTTGQTGALGKLLPEIKSLSKEQLKAGEAADYVAQKFEGFAEAAALTGAGPIKMLQNSFGDLQEQIGEAFMPIIVAITTKINELIQKFQNLDPEVKEAIVAWGVLIATIGPILVILPKIAGFFAVITGEVGLTVAAVLSLGLALMYIVKNWEAVKHNVNTMVEGATNLMLGGIPGLLKGKHKTQHGSGSSWGAGDESKGSSGYMNMQSMGDFMGSMAKDFGGGLFDMLGGNTGKAMQAQSEATINKLIGNINRLGIEVEKTGEKAKRALIHIAKIGSPHSKEIIEANAIFDQFSGGKGTMQGFVDYTKGKGTHKEQAGIDIGNIQGDPSAMFAGQEEAMKSYAQTWSTVGDAVGGAISQMGQDLEAGMGFFAAFGKAALMAAADVAKAALVKIAAEAIASGAKKGLPGILIGTAAAIAGISILQGLISGIGKPALAEGGLAYGPTSATVGDNPNAHIDPEVIAPLSKLKGIMGQGGGNGYIAETRISGDDLLVLVSKAQDRGFRRGSASIVR